MGQPSSRTIVRAWNAAGYHRDILILDSNQVRMHDSACRHSPVYSIVPPIGVRMVIDPKDFPEMTEFEIIIEEYDR